MSAKKNYDMHYTKDSKIETLMDVVNFVEHIILEKDVSFHPDDGFDLYVNNVDGGPSFSEDECKLYNRLNEECFKVCEREGLEYYRIGFGTMRRMLREGTFDGIEINDLVRIKGEEKVYKVTCVINDTCELIPLVSGQFPITIKTDIHNCDLI